MGGGKAGLADRLGGKAGHSKFMCNICKTPAPSLTNMQVRHFVMPKHVCSSAFVYRAWLAGGEWALLQPPGSNASHVCHAGYAIRLRSII